MSRVSFTINGEPVAKGSRTQGRHGGSWESSKRVAPWMKDAVSQLAEAKLGLTAGPVVVDLVFVHRKPARPVRNYPSRSDVDKTCRAVLDALVQAGVIEDDRHVVGLCACKYFGEVPFVSGSIRSVADDEVSDWPKARKAA